MRLGAVLSLLLWTATASALASGNARVIKVLPQFLDLNGRHALSPSLYERDAYQARLRQHPDERSGLRFAVQWRMKARPTGPLKLRVETRSVVQDEPTHRSVFEQPLKWRNRFRRWAEIRIQGKDYLGFGELTAWRATLWDGDEMIAEAKSFLW